MKSTNKSDLSLAEVHGSVDTTQRKGFKKIIAFMGPAYLVSVGYMDPGNWATDIAGGSKFGYALVWVLVMSNLIALLLQSHSARLGIVRGKDLAQASRDTYSKPVNISLYVLAEIAIAACDLAEVLGMAIGLQLLFDIPLFYGVCITVLDTILLLFLINFGMRKMEAFIIGLIAVIGLAFLTEMFLAKPDIADIATGLIPSIPNDEALYIAIGIIGATVMPHNLYLHSSLVQTRKYDRSDEGIKKAIKYNIMDSAIALNLALFVNAAILILAASTFYKNGYFEVAEIKDAHLFLDRLLGSSLAPKLFAVALICAGQSSTITGTLAGQIVMEGYLNLRITPWIRRLLTRSIAIIPALCCIYYFGDSSTGKLLVFSQVILSMQLGFAIIPLIHFVSDKTNMGKFSINRFTQCISWLAASIIVFLNIKLVAEFIVPILENPAESWLLKIFLVTACLLFCFLLVFIVIQPLLKRNLKPYHTSTHAAEKDLVAIEPVTYQRIAVAIDFSKMDQLNISNAIKQGDKEAQYLLIHIVETAGALMMGSDIKDHETKTDKTRIQRYAAALHAMGYKVDIKIGYGTPKKAIPMIVNEFNADLLIMGAHGHRGISDLLYGTTVDAVRHKIKIPIFISR
ncbi:MAG: hypothetical protein RIQ89_2084 [Bacteroidota bacterium]